MADYPTALAIVFQQEGGFNKNLGDGAGMTYRGLTVNDDKDFAGWSYINNYISQNGYPAEEYVFPDLEQGVSDYYKAKYWVMSQGDNINDQDTADFVFSFCVNSGRACVEINDAINTAMGSTVVPVTNTLSDTAVSYLNNYTDTIYPVLYQQRLSYLESNSKWGKYHKGWERMMALYPSVLPIALQRVIASKTGYFGLMGGGGLILIGVFGYIGYKKGVFNNIKLPDFKHFKLPK